MKLLVASFISIACLHCSNIRAQAILDKSVGAPARLQELDSAIREQLIIWFDAREAKRKEFGRDSKEAFTVSEELNPLNVLSGRILSYAKEQAGTPEALVCLAYVVDWGEGGQHEVFATAADIILEHYMNSDAVSWICSRCTRSLNLDTLEPFLRTLYEKSSNPIVQGAAAYNLAILFDN